MKIFALSVVRNEADVIEENLRAASKWADRIFVYDNGSNDGTWEKVLAMQDDKIVAWKQDGKPFQESLRAEPFNDRRSEASNGDWWCRLDADEFYIDDPRAFLSHIPSWQHVVWGIAVEYYLTHEEHRQIDFNAPTAAILSGLHYYRAEHSEPRFFRYRPGLVWNETDAWPLHMGIAAPELISYKHYKYRSPAQIQKRIDTRRDSQQRGFAEREHYGARNWEECLSETDDLDYDNGDGHYRIRRESLPNHTESTWRRQLKRLMHGLQIWP